MVIQIGFVAQTNFRTEISRPAGRASPVGAVPTGAPLYIRCRSIVILKAPKGRFFPFLPKAY